MVAASHPTPAHQCPLCGKDNRCAMEIERATGLAQPPCWCVAESFPPELFSSLPAAARGMACICIDCVRAHALTVDPPSGAAA